MNTVETCFSELQLPQLDCTCLLWLNSWKFTNQPASYAFLLILPFFVFPVCTHTHLVRDLFIVLCCPSGTVSFAVWDHQTHSYLSNQLWNLTSSSCHTDCVHAYACRSLFRLCFGSLLCCGLCALVWRNSTYNSCIIIIIGACHAITSCAPAILITSSCHMCLPAYPPVISTYHLHHVTAPSTPIILWAPATPIILSEPATPIILSEPATPIILSEPATPIILSEPTLYHIVWTCHPHHIVWTCHPYHIVWTYPLSYCLNLPSIIWHAFAPCTFPMFWC